MSQKSTFDCLPNELIVCIFSYLKPDDNFRSFFVYNNRLRKLVKRYLPFSRRDLEKDIKRFSKLHSWNKHLNYINDGDSFYMIPVKGEQERYDVDPCISDYNGIHWHFRKQYSVRLEDERIQQIVQKYPIKLNPSFHPEGPQSGVLTAGFQDFVRRHYPFQFECLAITLFNRSAKCLFDLVEFFTDEIMIQLQYVYDNEPKRLKNIIFNAAQCIWNELQELEDVNILKIKYHQTSFNKFI
ncbi:unnamed protein product [Rotaria sp. Silwood1]|nr:unnamed protein product [Rotaria sp. Silwood1]CAF4921873.1 unnamed protein product [Rotaria sp. Silwood1]